LTARQYTKHIYPRIEQIEKKIELLKLQLIHDRDKTKRMKEFSAYDLQCGLIEKRLDTSIQDLAWCYDTIAKISHIKDHKEYRKGWLYKIRKALGYTYP
jgi:hypothetical protein